MLWEDPIVADVRRIKEELAAKFNFDAAAILADIRQRQLQLGDRLVKASGEQNKQIQTCDALPEKSAT